MFTRRSRSTRFSSSRAGINSMFRLSSRPKRQVNFPCFILSSVFRTDPLHQPIVVVLMLLNNGPVLAFSGIIPPPSLFRPIRHSLSIRIVLRLVTKFIASADHHAVSSPSIRVMSMKDAIIQRSYCPLQVSHLAGEFANDFFLQFSKTAEWQC